MVDGMDIEIKRYNYESKEYDTLAEVTVADIASSATMENMACFLSEFMNRRGGGFGMGKRIGELLCHDHRTLQRLEIAFALGLIVGLSEQEYTDPRNETAIKTAKKIAKLAADGELDLGLFI